MRRLVFVLIGALCLPPVSGAITAGEFDDFQSGSLEGWGSGVSNPNPPANQADRGPLGPGDRALVLTANGTVGAGGKLVTFNTSQWAGDYLSVGVTDIEIDLLNLGDEELTVRLVLSSGTSSYATVDSAVLPAGGEVFTNASFSVRAGDLVPVAGVGGVSSVLGNVTEVRILHSAAPSLRGDVVTGQLAVDNILALAGSAELQCLSDAVKTDSPADFLLLPGFEVDTESATGLTTFFSVHNQTDEPLVARVRYFDRAGVIRNQVDLGLAPRQTRTTDIRSVDGLPVDDDGFARGAVQVVACSQTGGDLTSALSGDYLLLDNANDFATGDQLLRREDICRTVQVRLLNFGSGIRLRLYSTEPQGEVGPTATYTVFNEAGNQVGSGEFMTGDNVGIFNTSELTATNFGTLVVEFVQGGGALSVEYSAFGRFSVAMNATCVTPHEP